MLPPLRAIAALVLAHACCGPLLAQSPLGSRVIASGLDHPIYVTAPPGDFGRIFVLEWGTTPMASVRVVDITQDPPLVQPWPYVTVGTVYVSGEGGMLCMTFHPQFAANGYFYLLYTANVADDVRIVRYQALAPYATSTDADLGSATPVITIPSPGHNGGWMGFGPDGYLYVSTGEWPNTTQSLADLHGKILRLDVDGDDFPSDPQRNYAIPPSNPFAGSSTAAPETLHYGLRNPYRCSIDRLTGELWIGDVGAGAFEEIDYVPVGTTGLDFGWNCMEAAFCTGSSACICNDPALTLPVFAYPHTGGNGCVIGGYRYRGSALCGFQDAYFFGDWVAARVWTLRWDGASAHDLVERTGEIWPVSAHRPYSFGEDAAGELYIVAMDLGTVYQIVPGTITDCNQNGVHDGCDIAEGTSQDWNGNHLPDECEPTGVPGCFGDGSTPTACPCGNTGGLGRGCDNSAATGGARLDGVGEPVDDDVVLISSGELPTTLTIFLQGDALDASGATFGDGVLCVAGSLKRLYVKSASGGVAHAPDAGDPSIATRSAQLGDPLLPSSGQLRYYQAYYRDPSPSFCAAPPGDTWNVSSLIVITW